MWIVQLELGTEPIRALDFLDNAVAETEIDTLKPATGVVARSKNERVMLLNIG
jgi:hypothetical protein